MFSGYAALTAGLFGTDMILKKTVEDKLEPGEEHKLFHGRILLRRVYNYGAMLNILSDHPKIIKSTSLLLGAGMLICDMVFWPLRGRHIQKLGLSLFTGGALSNIFDRLIRGRVVDYFGIQTRWKRFTDITFNLGDLFIFTGALLVSVFPGFCKK